MNVFYELFNGTDMDKEKSSELSQMSIETPKLKYKEEKKRKEKKGT